MMPGVLRRFLDQPRNRAGRHQPGRDHLDVRHARRGTGDSPGCCCGPGRGRPGGARPRSPPRSARSWTSTCRAGSGPRPAAGTAEPRPRGPRSGHTAAGGVRDARWSVRGLRQPDRASGCGWTRRGRSAASQPASVPGRTPRPTPRVRPVRRTLARVPEGRPDSAWRTSHGIGEAAREGRDSRPGFRPPRLVRQERDRLAARDCRAPLSRARQTAAEEARRRLAAGGYMPCRPRTVLCSVMNSGVPAGIAVAGLARL